MQLRLFSLFLSVATASATAQSSALVPIPIQQQIWKIQDSGTTAGLRGLDSVDGTVAWASGTEGTVLKTTDGGAHWTKCAVPGADKDGATLDFRGVQAWDATTAIVMASGPGDKSRLYKTTDGCKSWQLILINPDKNGFWDAVRFSNLPTQKGLAANGILVGDPIRGKFPIFTISDQGDSWRRWGGMESDEEGGDKELQADAKAGESLFAASNQSLAVWSGDSFIFVTGGAFGARLVYSDEKGLCQELGGTCRVSFSDLPLPVLQSGPASGAFAIGSKGQKSYWPLKLMIVGGDYTKPDQALGTSVFLSSRDGAHIPFTSYFDVVAPTTPPHGYRSTVQWSESLKAWITAGTNGSDISRDDGRTWQPLDNGNWNALSLPFIVGPKGRIGRLNTSAILKGN
jgi:photosystem II stability/assembly factor-like uncharacterized protein